MCNTDIERNNIWDGGVNAIQTSIQQCVPLTRLNIGINTIHIDEGHNMMKEEKYSQRMHNPPDFISVYNIEYRQRVIF